MNKFFSAAMMIVTATAMSALGVGCASADPTETDSVAAEGNGEFAKDSWRLSCWGGGGVDVGGIANCTPLTYGSSNENYSIGALQRACDALAAKMANGQIPMTNDAQIKFANGQTALCSSLNNVANPVQQPAQAAKVGGVQAVGGVHAVGGVQAVAR